MYVKTRTFQLINSVMDANKLFFPKNKTKSHGILLKIYKQHHWKLLKPSYKYTKITILLAAHTKK